MAAGHSNFLLGGGEVGTYTLRITSAIGDHSSVCNRTGIVSSHSNAVYHRQNIL